MLTISHNAALPRIRVAMVGGVPFCHVERGRPLDEGAETRRLGRGEGFAVVIGLAMTLANEFRSRVSLPPLRGGAVLVVDDDPGARALLVRALERSGMNAIEAGTGEQALDKIFAAPDQIEAVVLDVQMPGMSGFDVLRALKRSPATLAIPIVMVTATATEEEDIVRGVETGAVDYMPKPYSPSVLVAKVRAACERSKAEKDLRRDLQFAELHATIDPLTGLYNRLHFETRLREMAAHARRHDEPFALLMADLDFFKRVNDDHGHEEGDRVLVHFAAAVRGILRGEDHAFRYGGEEFVLLLKKCTAERAFEVASRLREKLRGFPHRLANGQALVVTFSGGIAAASAEEGFAAEELVSRADGALYRAKRAGRDRTLRW